MGSTNEMKIAFVLGNGHSRSVFDLAMLKGKGVTYGCNLLVEEFPLDNTIVCDRGVAVYLAANGFSEQTNMWTRNRWRDIIGDENNRLKALSNPIENCETRWDRELHWGSGTHALNLAAEQGADVVAMIGFDLWIREDGKNNIYQDREPFYKIGAVDPDCWIHQIERLLQKYPDTSFVQIQPTSWRDPESWTKYNNYSRDTYAGLKTLLEDIESSD